MMYKSKLVAAIKVNGQTLREEGETVRLPFGSEYSLYFQNLNYSQRCVLSITADGSSITGEGLVLGAGETATLEHPVGDQRRFKFIERTAGIENYRGINPNDGLIVINYQFEVAVNIPTDLKPKFYDYYSAPIFSDNRTLDGKNQVRGISRGVESFSVDADCSSSRSYNQVGITGHGSVSNQKFKTTSIRTLEPQIHTIVFRLLGGVDSVKDGYKLVQKPVSVKTKKICSMCGRTFNSNVGYCPDDGNALDFDSSIF